MKEIEGLPSEGSHRINAESKVARGEVLDRTIIAGPTLHESTTKTAALVQSLGEEI